MGFLNRFPGEMWDRPPFGDDEVRPLLLLVVGSDWRFPSLGADFREVDLDSNFSVFRVRRFTEWPGPLHWLAFPVEILTRPLIHWIPPPPFHWKPLFFLTEKCFQKSAPMESLYFEESDVLQSTVLTCIAPSMVTMVWSSTKALQLWRFFSATDWLCLALGRLASSHLTERGARMGLLKFSTVRTKIIADPEKCFHKLISEKPLILLWDRPGLELIIVSSNFNALVFLQDKLLESVWKLLIPAK